MSGCGILFTLLEAVFTRLSDVFYLMNSFKRSRNVGFEISAGCFMKVMSLKSYYYGTYSENVGNMVNAYGKCLLKLSEKFGVKLWLSCCFSFVRCDCQVLVFSQ